LLKFQEPSNKKKYEPFSLREKRVFIFEVDRIVESYLTSSSAGAAPSWQI
jgi:hypothetical protein